MSYRASRFGDSVSRTFHRGECADRAVGRIERFEAGFIERQQVANALPAVEDREGAEYVRSC
jgi:hypothetical protein